MTEHDSLVTSSDPQTGQHYWFHGSWTVSGPHPVGSPSGCDILQQLLLAHPDSHGIPATEVSTIW